MHCLSFHAQVQSPAPLHRVCNALQVYNDIHSPEEGITQIIHLELCRIHINNGLTSQFSLFITKGATAIMTTPDLTKPCRLIRRNHFFIIHVQDCTVLSRYSRGTGLRDHQSTHKYQSHQLALNAASDIFNSKITDGYSLAPDDQGSATTNLRRSSRNRTSPQRYNTTTPSKKRSRANSKSEPVVQPAQPHASSVVKKKRRGLRGAAAVQTSAPLGVPDPASGLDGPILPITDEFGNTTGLFDVMLVLVDIAKRHDKYIVLQLIHCEAEDSLVIYQRFGRTGTSGQSIKTQYPCSSRQKAIRDFKDKVKQKTGLDWDQRESPPIPGKYRFVVQDFQAKYEATVSDLATWQYWVNDFVDGKQTGWYNYDDFGNVLAEQLYLEFLNNAWLTQRIVQSGTYSYLVDLESMTQQNAVHPNHTVRHIRRVPPNETPDNEDPTDDFPATTVSNMNSVQVMTMRVTKPNVNVPKAKPQHQVKVAPQAVVPDLGKPIKAAKSEAVEQTSKGNKAVVIPVDNMCPKAHEYRVLGDWDATLNQANIMDGNNSNKYYRIQLLEHKRKKTFYVWTRWGRVGESRGTQTKLMGDYKELQQAENAFEKKFRDKSANSWKNRKNFVPVSGKYTLLEIDHSAKKEEHQEPLMMKITREDKTVEYLPSNLSNETKKLVELLFEKDVYTNAMKEFDIDVRKMPLGNLSTEQIDKGVAVLEEIEAALKGTPIATSSKLASLSSKFYTALPHDFGRRRPPVISNMTMLQNSYDMCNVLKDMEKAAVLMSEADKSASKEEDKKTVPHPVDAQYASLNADLGLLDPSSEEYKLVSAAYHNTCGDYDSKLLNIWRVERRGEAERFGKVGFPNHMLLWHGSHIGAISAILATGLRIMPHSGGRVGRGIYLASENGKSQQYTTPARHERTACMFLVQAALGRSWEIFQDNSSLTRPPSGYQSVLACGRQTPKGCSSLSLDGVPVSIPVEAPAPNSKVTESAFAQDEYLIYNEAQARIRYVVTIEK